MQAEASIFSTYNAATGKVLPEEAAKDVMSCLLSFRNVFDEIVSNAPILFRTLFSSAPTKKLIFPCDVVELRGILDENLLSVNHKCLPLFAWTFANRYLKHYPVFLIIDSRNIETECKDYGGIVLYDAQKLSVDGAILRVIANQPSSPGVINAVRKILQDCNKGIEFGISNSVPGVSPSMPGIGSTAVVKSKMQKEAIVKPEINITPFEAQLFNKIKEARDRAGLKGKVEVRAAGGWVRDKLMGKESKDIDFALTNMTGAQFCKATGLPMDAVIAANDAKSKQLETVKTHIDGQEVDFANCRTEVYEPGSRVPKQSIGTPEEDAMRRDLTINSMFFNIESSQVEDFAGGREDLERKVLRTPLDPKVTFMQDAIRMLRALRFRSRFSDFQLDPAMVEAMKDPEVQQQYVQQISMERAGPELMGMMMGDDPSSAVRVLFETGLYKVAFRTPGMQPTLGIDIDQKNEHHKLSLMNHTIEVVKNLNDLMKQEGEDKKMRGLMNLAALFHDFGKMHPDGRQPHPTKPGQMQYLKHEDVSATLADEILKSIGVGDDDRQVVRAVVKNHMRPHNTEWSNQAMGRFMRDLTIPGQEGIENKLWRYTMLHGIADSMSKGDDSWHDDVNSKREHMSRFTDYLNAPPPRKPLLDGKAIMQMIPELKPDTGFIKEVSEMLTSAQDAREITTPEEAAQKVLAWKAQNLGRYQNAPPKQKKQPQQKPKPQQPVTQIAPQPDAAQSEGQKQGMNWYKRNKIADKRKDHTEDDVNVYKGTPLDGMKDEVVKMVRYRTKPEGHGPAIERLPNGEVHKNDVVQLPHRIGDEVRDRRHGVAIKQRFGKITNLTTDEKGFKTYHVTWEDDKEPEKFRLDDTISLASILARV